MSELTSLCTVGSVKSDLTYIAEAWPSVVHLSTKGTPRAWSQVELRTPLSEGQIAERFGRGGVFHPQPIDLGVLDLLNAIASVIDDIVRTVVAVAGLTDDHLPALAASVDPRPSIRVIKEWVQYADECDSKTVPWVAKYLTGLCERIARLLGDVRDGQVMNAICPWCTGRTQSGTGFRTLHIHYGADVDGDGDRPSSTIDESIIVCHGLNCDPPSSACGTRRDGKPAWPHREWAWLSGMLKVSADATT